MDVRTGFLAFLLAMLGIIATLMVIPLLQYVLAAGLLAFVCYPAQKRLEPTVGPRVAALLITGVAIVATVIPVLIFSIIILQTVLQFLQEFDSIATLSWLRELASEMGIDDDIIAELETQAAAEAERLIAESVERMLLELVGLVQVSIEMGIGLLILVFLLYYLLVDGPTFVAWLGTVSPLDADIRNQLFEEVEEVTWAVIRSHVLVALIEGILGGIGLYLLGVPNVAFWTVVMIVVSFLPAIGVWLVWGPAVVYLAVVVDPLNGFVLLLYGIAVLSVVDNYLRAIFVDRRSGLHPAVVLVGVIGGIYLLGIMGLFLGPVLLAVFKATLNVFEETELSPA